MLQENLAFQSREGEHVRYADGVRIDFDPPTLSPVHIEVLPSLLHRSFRFGVFAPTRTWQRETVLVHSILVGRVAKVFASKVYGPGERATLCGVYGALHDLGEIWGGDVVALLPEAAVAPLRAYQHMARDQLVESLGLPKPTEMIKDIVKAADVAVYGPESRWQGLGDETVPHELWWEHCKQHLPKVGIGWGPREVDRTVFRELEAMRRGPGLFPDLKAARAQFLTITCTPLVVYRGGGLGNFEIWHRRFFGLDDSLKRGPGVYYFLNEMRADGRARVVPAPDPEQMS